MYESRINSLIHEKESAISHVNYLNQENQVFKIENQALKINIEQLSIEYEKKKAEYEKKNAECEKMWRENLRLKKILEEKEKPQE